MPKKGSIVRTVISLPSDDKAWLERKAKKSGVSMAEVIRSAVRRLRKAEDESFEDLLRRTRGLWRGEDGLTYQRRLRKQWR